MQKNQTDLLYAVRALNHWRPVHQPTYMALRFLLDSIVARNSPWVERFVNWKFPTRSVPRYFPFQQYKGTSTEGRIVYRDLFSSSPSTALAESLALSKLSGLNSFRKHPRVFSYLWPQEKRSGRDYEFFAVGYQKRNDQVSHLLRTDPEKIAVITDIKNFYPSVNKQKVLARFKERISSSDIQPAESATLVSVCEGMLSVVGNGIPVGPPLSHVCADIALERFDREMVDRVGGNYTRYVDDIVFVVDKSEEKDIIRLIDSMLETEGLQRNPDKTDVLTAPEWIENVPKLPLGPKPGSFEEMKMRLVRFLAVKQDQYEVLNNTFKDNGFSLPIERMRADANYGRMQGFLWFLIRRDGFGLRSLYDTKEKLLESAIFLRERLKKELQTILSERQPSKATTRKWQTQRKRYVLNRLLYLVQQADYEGLLNQIEKESDLTHHIILLKSLVSGNADSIIQMPGPQMSSFAFLLSQQQSSPGIDWKTIPTRAVVESISMLALAGLADPPSAFMEKCAPIDRGLLSFSSLTKQSVVSHDFSYLDEINTLRGGKTRRDVRELLSSRFDDRESVWLDLLDVGEEYFYG